MTNKPRIPILFLLSGTFLLLASCKNGGPSGDLITVDLNEGLKTEKEFRLSEVAKSVEYIPLETRQESLFSNAGYVISKNYVLVYQQYGPCRLLLFDRSGKFLRKIGGEGKGPGEYISLNYVYPEPDEKFILIYDYQAQRIIRYGFDGSLISEMSVKEMFKTGINRMIFLDGERIAILFSRPTFDADHFPLVRIVDYDFKALEEKHFVSTKALNASGWATGGPSFYLADNRLHLREFFYDTLYVDSGEDFKAKYYFKLDGIKPPGHYITFGPQGGGYSPFMYAGVSDCVTLGDLIFHTIVPKPQEENPDFEFLIYNTRNQELFAIKDVPRCSDDPEARSGPAITNDLDGYLYLRSFKRTGNLIYRPLEMLDLIDWKEKGCAERIEVKFPDKRDELAKIIGGRTIDDNPVLQIFTLK